MSLRPATSPETYSELAVLEKDTLSVPFQQKNRNSSHPAVLDLLNAQATALYFETNSLVNCDSCSRCNIFLIAMEKQDALRIQTGFEKTQHILLTLAPKTRDNFGNF